MTREELEKLAIEYAYNVAQPAMRDMLSMSRGEYARRLQHAVEHGIRLGREQALNEVLGCVGREQTYHEVRDKRRENE